MGEAQYTRVQREDEDDLSFWGAYAYVSLFLTDDYMSWNRKTGTLGRIKPSRNLFLLGDSDSKKVGSGAWQVAVRYSYTNLTNRDVRGGVGHNVTAGLNWYFNAFSRLQLNYIRGQIADQSSLNPQQTDNQSSPRNAERAEYDIVGARLMVDF